MTTPFVPPSKENTIAAEDEEEDSPDIPDVEPVPVHNAKSPYDEEDASVHASIPYQPPVIQQQRSVPVQPQQQPPGPANVPPAPPQANHTNGNESGNANTNTVEMAGGIVAGGSVGEVTTGKINEVSIPLSDKAQPDSQEQPQPQQEQNEEQPHDKGDKESSYISEQASQQDQCQQQQQESQCLQEQGQSASDKVTRETNTTNTTTTNHDTTITTENAGNTTTGQQETLDHTPPSDKRAKKKAGSKKGAKRHDRPQSFWYRLCQLYEQGDYKSQIEFLRSNDSGADVGEAHRMHFSRAYRKYQAGNLANSEETRTRKRKYEPLEQRVIQFWQQQQERHYQQQQQQLQWFHTNHDNNNNQQQQNTDEERGGTTERGQHHRNQHFDDHTNELHQIQQEILEGEYNNHHHKYNHNNKRSRHDNQSQNDEHGFDDMMEENDTQNDNQNDNNDNEDNNDNNGRYQILLPPSRRKKTPDNNNSHRQRPSYNHHHPRAGGVSWTILQEKAKQWAQEMGLAEGFQASAGWIDNVLKRHLRQEEAQRARAVLEQTQNQRRTAIEYQQQRERAMRRFHHQEQLDYLQQKQLRVGDRVTVLDVSHQPGDVVITQLYQSGKSDSKKNNADNSINATRGKKDTKNKQCESDDYQDGDHEQSQDENPNDSNVPPEIAYVTVERKRHGSISCFPVTDVRKVVKHHSAFAYNNNGAMIRFLLQPDPYLRHVAQFHDTTGGGSGTGGIKASRIFRPIFEDRHHDHPNHDNESQQQFQSTVCDYYNDCTCAEKISIQALRAHLAPQFRRDAKARAKLKEELERKTKRSPLHQHVLEKLQRAQEVSDMIQDLRELVKDIPTKAGTVTYQVQYQALDASMRGHLVAMHPSPMAVDPTKSYAPRSLTLNAMPQDLRNALVGQFCHFVTVDPDEDMMLGILCSLAAQCGVLHLMPSWSDYRNHAASWCEFIQQIFHVSPQHAALLPRCLLHGGTIETWQQAMQEQTQLHVPPPQDEAWLSLQSFVVRLNTEWQALRDIVLMKPQFAWIEVDRRILQMQGASPNTVGDQCMVRIMQACQQEIWNITAHIFRTTTHKNDWTIRAQLLDGLLVEPTTQSSTTRQTLTQVIGIAEHAIRERGWDTLSLVEGPCHGLLYSGKKVLPSLKEARQAMEALTKANENAKANNTDSMVITNANSEHENTATERAAHPETAGMGKTNNSLPAAVNAGIPDLPLAVGDASKKLGRQSAGLPLAATDARKRVDHQSVDAENDMTATLPQLDPNVDNPALTDAHNNNSIDNTTTKFNAESQFFV